MFGGDRAAGAARCSCRASLDVAVGGAAAAGVRPLNAFHVVLVQRRLIFFIERIELVDGRELAKGLVYDGLGVR